MDQPLSLGAIARASGADLLVTRALAPAQIKVLRSIADCRTEAMGGHRDRCDQCDYEHTFWNSCRDRHCPGCGAEARESWLEKRREEVLDVPYFHVVFTIPEPLNALALHAPEVLYAILLRAAGQALTDVAVSKLRAHIGVLTVLHTWGQTLVARCFSAKILQEAALAASTLVRIHHRDTETQRGMEISLKKGFLRPPSVPLCLCGESPCA